MSSKEPMRNIFTAMQQCSNAPMQQCSNAAMSVMKRKKFKHLDRFSAAHQQPGANPIKHFCL
jgi:hypothetical protein